MPNFIFCKSSQWYFRFWDLGGSSPQISGGYLGGIPSSYLPPLEISPQFETEFKS